MEAAQRCLAAEEQHSERHYGKQPPDVLPRVFLALSIVILCLGLGHEEDERKKYHVRHDDPKSCPSSRTWKVFCEAYGGGNDYQAYPEKKAEAHEPEHAGRG